MCTCLLKYWQLHCSYEYIKQLRRLVRADQGTFSPLLSGQLWVPAIALIVAFLCM